MAERDFDDPEAVRSVHDASSSAISSAATWVSVLSVTFAILVVVVVIFLALVG